MDQYSLYDFGNNGCCELNMSLKSATELVKIKSNCYGACDRIALPLPTNVDDVGILISLIENHPRKKDIKKLIIKYAKSICRLCKSWNIQTEMPGGGGVSTFEGNRFDVAVKTLLVYANTKDNKPGNVSDSNGTEICIVG